MERFLQYINEFNKSYVTLEDFVERYAIFLKNDKVMTEHNNANNTFTLGHNQFSDMKPEEVNNYLGFNNLQLYKSLNVQSLTYANETLPSQVDWRKSNAVNPVKNQGQCGSCYAESAIAVLETQNYLTNKELLDLSVQQAVDCDPKSLGCNGGLQENVFEYLQNHYLEETNQYPYQAKTEQCKYDASGKVLVDTIYQLKPYDIESIKLALTKGVIAMTVQADQPIFQLYKSGILNSNKCYKGSLDHAVTAVGYGFDEATQQDYVIVRNSWGQSWGDKGYIHIALNDDNVCGILMHNLYATVKPYNNTQLKNTYIK